MLWLVLIATRATASFAATALSVHKAVTAKVAYGSSFRMNTGMGLLGGFVALATLAQLIGDGTGAAVLTLVGWSGAVIASLLIFSAVLRPSDYP